MEKGTVERSAVGRNVEAIVDGDMLTLVINLGEAIGPSRSGKNTLIASTLGNVRLPSGVKLGLNVFRSIGK